MSRRRLPVLPLCIAPRPLTFHLNVLFLCARTHMSLPHRSRPEKNAEAPVTPVTAMIRNHMRCRSIARAEVMTCPSLCMPLVGKCAHRTQMCPLWTNQGLEGRAIASALKVASASTGKHCREKAQGKEVRLFQPHLASITKKVLCNLCLVKYH